MRKLFFVLSLLFVASVASTAWGHMLWINASDYSPAVGQSVRIEIAWGHKFPKDELIKKERLARAYALAPDGKAAPLKQLSEGQYELAVQQKGAYLVYAQIHPGVYTKTTEGYKRQNKKGLANALHCVSYGMRAKAVINAGGQEQGLGYETNDFLDVVPMANPASLQEGDTLPVKFLFKGAPLPPGNIHATYAGFSEDGKTFAVSTTVDGEGMADIKLIHKGEWLIQVPYKRPYPNQEECDELYSCMTITFGIK